MARLYQASVYIERTPNGKDADRTDDGGPEVTTEAIKSADTTEQSSLAATAFFRLSPAEEAPSQDIDAHQGRARKPRAAARSYFLPVPVDLAARECQKLNLERFQIRLVPIAVVGGCVVAVVPLRPKPRRQSRLTSTLRNLRERQAVDRAITQLGQRLVLQT